MVRFFVFLFLATACAATAPRPVASAPPVVSELPRLRELDLRGTGVSAETQALLEREHGVRLMRPSP